MGLTAEIRARIQTYMTDRGYKRTVDNMYWKPISSTLNAWAAFAINFNGVFIHPRVGVVAPRVNAFLRDILPRIDVDVQEFNARFPYTVVTDLGREAGRMPQWSAVRGESIDDVLACFEKVGLAYFLRFQSIESVAAALREKGWASAWAPWTTPTAFAMAGDAEGFDVYQQDLRDAGFEFPDSYPRFIEAVRAAFPLPV